MQQEVVLAMLAKEPSQGYQLRARLNDALGPLGEALNAGQIYVRSRSVGEGRAWSRSRRTAATRDRERKVYVLTAAGQERVGEWLAEVSWPKPDLAEFHLKLDRRGRGRAGRPDRHRRRAAPRAAAATPRRAAGRDGRARRLDAALLLEGIVLRLQADLRWLEACEANWTTRRRRQ